MIGALIVLLIMLVILAIFIGKNVHHTCSIWLFHEFKDMSSVSVILIAFAVGIVFTMFCFFISYLVKKDKMNKALNPQKDESSEKVEKVNRFEKRKNKPAFKFKTKVNEKKEAEPLNNKTENSDTSTI
ncbi:MAG: hypothetical protein K5829_14125 [Treponema sp.]|nr:hypothetical protein [Treponema sp.]